MKVYIKSSSSLTLEKLLKRRKVSLRQFLTEQGITTYEGLKARCRNLGVVPPTESEYGKTLPETVTNQTEGLIVIDPIQVTDEKTGKGLEEDSPRPELVKLSGITIEEDKPKRRRRGKRKAFVKEEPEELQVDEPQPEEEELEVVDIPEPRSIDSIDELDRLLSGSN